MAVVDGGILMVALRESLEAFLIVGILAGIVIKLGHPKARRPIFNGAVAGLAASIVLGLAIYASAREAFDRNEALFEGLATLLAVGVLTYMIVWMYQHTKTMFGAFHDKAKAALQADRSGALWLLSFVAVLREGIETVLFVGSKVGQASPAAVWTSLAIGLGVSAVLAFLLFSGVVRLSVERFFAVTGLALVVIAGGLLAYSLHELHEAGWIPGTPTAWSLPLSHREGVGAVLHGLVAYRSSPNWLEVAAWVSYVGAMSAWYLRGLLRHRRAHAAHHPRDPEPAAR